MFSAKFGILSQTGESGLAQSQLFCKTPTSQSQPFSPKIDIFHEKNEMLLGTKTQTWPKIILRAPLINITFFRSRESKTKKIFVGGVSQETATEEVREYFLQFGESTLFKPPSPPLTPLD